MLYYWQIFSKKKKTTFTRSLVWRLMCAQAWAWSKCDLYCNKNKWHIKSKCVTPKLVYNCQKRVKNKVTPEKNSSWNVKNRLSISDIQFDFFFLKKKRFFFHIYFISALSVVRRAFEDCSTVKELHICLGNPVSTYYQSQLHYYCVLKH